MITERELASGSPRRRALVTGGAGFVGSCLANVLQGRGWQVEALDNLSTGDAANVPLGVKLHVGDIQSDSDIQTVMRWAAFDAAVHCAAQTSVERSMKDPELDHAINVLGTRRLAAAARKAGVGRFVFLSSGGAIYGETDEPADERAPLAPLSCYGRNKLMAEEEVREAGHSYCILRPSNVYGPGQRSDPEGGVVAIFRERLLGRKPLEIHCGGEQVRDFLYVMDVAAAVVAALSIQRNAIWNVASGEATRIIDLASVMAALVGSPLEVRHHPRRAGDVGRSLLSPATLLSTGLWGPPLPLIDGLRLTLAPAPEAVPVAVPEQ